MWNLPAVDWILLAVLGLSLLLGVWRGLVQELLSLAGWVAAFYLAQMYAPLTANALPMEGSSQMLRYAAGFLLTFIAVLVVLLAVTVLVGMTPMREAQAWQQSQGAAWLQQSLRLLKPVLPAEFGKYLP